MNTISTNKEAFEMFREEAVKKGLFKEDPLPKVHHRYYNKYIRPSVESPH